MCENRYTVVGVRTQPHKAWEIRGDNGGSEGRLPQDQFKMDQACLRPDCLIQATKNETIQGGFAKWEFSAGADGKLIIKQEPKLFFFLN